MRGVKRLKGSREEMQYCLEELQESEMYFYRLAIAEIDGNPALDRLLRSAGACPPGTMPFEPHFHVLSSHKTGYKEASPSRDKHGHQGCVVTVHTSQNRVFWFRFPSNRKGQLDRDTYTRYRFATSAT